jgi:hypothetical protein
VAASYIEVSKVSLSFSTSTVPRSGLDKGT